MKPAIERVEATNLNYRYQWEVESESSRGRFYKVSQKNDGSWACACVGWTRHVPRKDCRHILRVKAFETRGLPADLRTRIPDPLAARLHETAKDKLQCPDCPYKTASETAFAKHMEQLHAARPHQVARLITKVGREAEKGRAVPVKAPETEVVFLMQTKRRILLQD